MERLVICVLTVCLFSKSTCTLIIRHDRDVADNNRFLLESDGPLISAMHIDSAVSARYAEVIVTTYVENSKPNDRETTFFFYLPLSAFISKFTMKINGEIYSGVVMGKEEAKKTYEEAKRKNETAGHVEQETTLPTRRLDMDMFTISVNLAANTSAVFELRYQEQIERRNGVYKQVINVKPNQIIPDFKIKCSYNEPQGFELFNFTLPKSKNAISIPIQEAELRATPRKRILTYIPSEQTQTSFDPVNGIDGDFVVSYDVTHSDDGGMVIFTDDGYIVSYYSPTVSEADILPKDILFIIDISGSMSGDKIKQARNSLLQIIDELRVVDRFNIILFDNKVELYTEGFEQASLRNKNKAKTFAEKYVRADGGTGINDALLTGVKLFNSQPRQDSRGNVIIFLTDGQPTVGVTNTKDIRSNVRTENYYREGSGKTLVKAVIYCLAFGQNTNFEFLSNLAEENGGNARRIYERVDAKDQLVYFFDEVADPYLSQVSFSLCQSSDTGPFVKIVLDEESISRNEFPYYFSGSEIVVVAQMPEIPPGDWRVCMSGTGSSGAVNKVITPVKDAAVSIDPAFIENLYAYKQIKHYLIMAGTSQDELLAVKFTEMALNMSLEHQFVTPLTSMVVTFAMEKQPDRRGTGLEYARCCGSYQADVSLNKFVGQTAGARNSVCRLFDYFTALCILLSQMVIIRHLG